MSGSPGAYNPPMECHRAARRRNISMIIQSRDGFLIKERGHRANKRRSYYAMVPACVLDRESSVIDELISFAFDTLRARHLDVRVYDETATRAMAECKRSCYSGVQKD